jgi:hypothetical protein
MSKVRGALRLRVIALLGLVEFIGLVGFIRFVGLLLMVGGWRNALLEVGGNLRKVLPCCCHAVAWVD